MIENKFQQLTSDDILTTPAEREFGVNTIATLSGMGFEKRVAVLTLIIQEHAEFNKIAMAELMNFNMSLFLGFVHNSPDCTNKNDFIDDTIKLMLTMKSASGKAN